MNEPNISSIKAQNSADKTLTSRLRGLPYRYHLRSNSGSNGPIAKECHRFLVAGPF